MSHGGKRVGAGAKPKYGEITAVMRVPASKVTSVQQFLNKQPIVLYECKVEAGFPSPASDYIEGTLDLNDHLIKNPAATFFVRVSGESMVGAGMQPDDILIVDRSINPTNGKIVIAVLDGELTVKRLRMKNGQVYLMPENPNFQPIKVSTDSAFAIWGVVTNVIHPV